MSQDRARSRDRSRRDRQRSSDASRDRSMDRGRDRGSTKSSVNRVYVSNIPYEFRWQDMKDLFREQVGDVAFVEMFVDDHDKPKGVGIVEFVDPSSVKKCLEVMQRYEVKGRKLVIKEDSGNMRDKHGNIVGRGDRKSRRDDGSRFREDRDRRNGNANILSVDDGKWGNTYGLSPQFLESLHIDAPLTNRVFVANLDYNVDKKKLKEVFKLAGRIVGVEVSVDKDGRSRGFAVVEYDHPVEAVQAISMFHNQYLFDREMTVRMDRVSETVKLPEGLKSIGMGLGQNGEPLKNVAYNLPNSGAGQMIPGGAGILGAVPGANALQVATALSGLNSVPALGNLNPSVLNAAGLSSLTSNLLQNGLAGANDLQTLMNQNTSNLLAQSQQLSALQNAGPGNISNNSSNMNSGLSSGLGLNSGGGGNANQSSFGRSSGDSYNPNAPVTYPTNYGGAARKDFQLYSQTTNFGQMDMRSNMMKSVADSKQYSRKVLISNLPPSASFKLLQDKLNEFGEVSYWEEKGTGSYLVVYANEWQAERAIKNLDKARIDGRYIEARIYY